MNDVSFPPETCAALADIEDGATVWVRVEPWWTDPAPGDGASTRVDWRPPPDLVALLDARCDHHNHAITGPNKGECLDCVDGSALFTIQGVPGRWKLNALVPLVEKFYGNARPAARYTGSTESGVAYVMIAYDEEQRPGLHAITGSVPGPGDWVAQITKATP